VKLCSVTIDTPHLLVFHEKHTTLDHLDVPSTSLIIFKKPNTHLKTIKKKRWPMSILKG
jgi:hypothetical protein